MPHHKSVRPHGRRRGGPSMSKKITRRAFATSSAAAAAVAGFGFKPALAQAYPARPVTVIVPWGAGGGTDATARIVAALLEKDLGQPFNVVNRTGGSGVVGHSAIATAQPDGYTIGMLGNLDDALAGAYGTRTQELHAAGADERGSARHPGQFHLALQDRERARRRHQGRACRQVQSLGHRPGRHLAPGAGRLDAGDGTGAEPRGLGAVERRGARD